MFLLPIEYSKERANFGLRNPLLTTAESKEIQTLKLKVLGNLKINTPKFNPIGNLDISYKTIN